MRPEYFTNNYGSLWTIWQNSLGRCARDLHMQTALNRSFKLGRDLNQRDVIAVRKTVSGMAKLIYPHGDFGRGGDRKRS